MYCFQCGKSIPSESVFCLYCGTKQVAIQQDSKTATAKGGTLEQEPSNFGFFIFGERYRQVDVKNKKWDPSIPQWVQEKTFALGGPVLVWDFTTHQVHSLSAYEVMEILDRWKSSDQWKTDGIPMIETRFKIPDARKKKKGEATSDELNIEELRDDVELFRIQGKDADRFIKELESNRAELKAIRDRNEQYLDQIRAKYWQFMFDSYHKEQESKVDWTKLRLSWKRESDFHWTCHQEDLTGVVSLEDPYLQREKPKSKSRSFSVSSPLSFESNPFDELIKRHTLWHAVIRSVERNHFNTSQFTELQEALDWTEQNLLEVANQPVIANDGLEDEPAPFILNDEYRQKLSPFWINPAKLDSELLTYQAIIMIRSKPEMEEPFTFLSGKTIMTNQQYYSPARLASMVKLDDSCISFDFIIPDSELYRATSLTKFYNAQDAIDQAQKIWEKSMILPLFKAGTVLMARYGYHEVETGYECFLGECSSASEPRKDNQSREDFLAHLALRYTLINALDVDGFRSFIGLPKSYRSDEDLLRTLHQQRAKCEFVPLQARTESLKWLEEHPVPQAPSVVQPPRKKKK